MDKYPKMNLLNKPAQIAFLGVITCFLLSLPLFASEFYGVTDNNMGSYEGFWHAKNGTQGRLVAQIRPVSNNRYDGFILMTRPKNQPVTALLLNQGTATTTGVHFTGTTAEKNSQGELLAKTVGECELKNGKLTGNFTGDLGEGTFEASKAEKKSRSMGAKPPKRAIVLFDGKNANGWEDFHWPITNDGAIEVKNGDIHASDKLSSFRLHLEFRTPYMPAETGQARGNSGVYLQSKYEVQILDSFGLYPLQDNDCGGVYKVQAPQLNACLPPMEWQTFDITYIEGNPAKKEPPVITVIQNGVTVVDHAKVPEPLVKSGTGGGEENRGFLKLQDHGNPVQYRNIWVEPFFSAAKKK